MLVPKRPIGEGASLVARRKSAGARAWESKPPLLSEPPPRARVGLCAPGSSTGARGAGAASKRAARSGATCSGRAPCDARGTAGRAGPAVAVHCCAMSLAERRGDAGKRARGAAPLSPSALSRVGATGGGEVCCRWCSMGGAGGATRVPVCVPGGPRGEELSSGVRRTSVGAWVWGPMSSLRPAQPSCARIGMCARGSSPRGGRGAAAVVD